MFPLVGEGVSRRGFLRASVSLSAAVLWGGCATGVVRRRVAFSGYPFSLGVASGDPAPDGFVIWTRLAPNPLEGGGMPTERVEVSWIVAEDEQLTKVVRSGREVASAEWGHSVHAEVAGLAPDRWYWYQFKCGAEVSPVGRSRTTPAAGAVPKSFRFAFASCNHFETGYFTAFEHLARENADVIIHLGDYIYEDGGKDKQIRKHLGGEIRTLTEYRNRYAQYKLDPALQLAHACAPWLVTWDDHEVDNNYAGEISEHFDVRPRQLLERRAAAYQAYYEHMPLRRSSVPVGPDMQLYRRVSFGDLAEFFVLDARQYRSDQPCGDVRQPPCPDSYSPKASMLGKEQRDWLFRGLGGSSARWNVLAQQVMMARVDRKNGPLEEFSMDQWPGYEFERNKVTQFFMDRKVRNPVVLTGDIHSNWANELTVECDSDYEYPIAAEFVGTSISSGGDGRRKPVGLDKTLYENPFVKFHNAERGYVMCEVSPNHWRTDYRVVEFVTKPGAPIKTRATFHLEDGSSRLLKG